MLNTRALATVTDIGRMEFQANYFAATLLMPRTHFLEDFRRLTRDLNVHDRGYGALYVDAQACNLQSFRIVTDRMKQVYGVSRTAAKIRLESLGLLRDVRETGSLRSDLFFDTLPDR